MRVLDGAELFKYTEDALIYKTLETAALVELGIPYVDKEVGGLERGELGVVGMATGVGKSSLVLSSALTTPVKVGIISTEDLETVLGSRLAAATTGIDSRLIRQGSVEAEGWKTLPKERLQGLADKLCFAFVPGPSPKSVVAATKELTDRGCELIWFDYLQKTDKMDSDRRVMIGRTMRSYVNACADGGAAAMLVSQFSRKDPGCKPHINWLKESGDIENEARLILLGWEDFQDPSLVKIEIAKSTVGGRGTFYYKRDESGTLLPYDPDEGWE